VMQVDGDIFRLTVEAAPNGIVLANRQGKIVLVNAQTESLFGYPREEIVGQPIEILVPEAPRDHHGKLSETFPARPQARAMEAGRDLVGRRKGGTQFPVKIALNPVKTRGRTWILASIMDLTELKRGQEALRDSEDKFRSFFREARVGMAIVSLEGRFLAANAALCDFLGCSEQELLGKDFQAVTYPEDLARSIEKFNWALAGRGNFPRLEKRYVRRDGQVRWGEVSASVVRNANGEPQNFVTHILDITDRKRAEEAQRRLAAIVESSDDAILARDLDGIITDWNHAAEHLFGYTADEVIGKSVSVLLPPDRAHELVEIIGTLVHGDTVRHFETERQRKDGTRFAVSLTVSPVFDSEGRIVGVSAIARDISERKRQEEALHQKDRELSEAQRIAGIGSWTWSVRNDLVTWSEELYRIAGRDPMVSPPSCKEHSSLFAAGSWERLRRSVDEALRDGASFELDVEIIRPDGTTRWITTRGEAVGDTTGLIVGLRGTAQDITERKLADEAIARLGGRLIEAQEEERSRIARELHDDVGQRLAVLSWTLRGLHKELPPDAPACLSEQLDSTLSQASEISNEVRVLSHRLHSSHLDLMGLAVAMEDFCQEFAKRQNVEIDFTHGDLPKNIPPDVSLCLFRILQEGLHNAVKYSGVQRFEAGLQPVPGGVQLVIRDSGAGFDVQAAMKEQGLGLVSMRERVSLVRGTLTIESKPTKGTVINVRVPLASTATAATGV
jgi:PAS domain S-box-containing protein